MEENNKEVKMSVATNNTNKNQKYTYEQLNDICNKLFQENKYLKTQMQQMSETINFINRLEYLFRVIDIHHHNADNYISFSDDFVSKCIHEVQESLFPVENKTTIEEK